MSENMDTLEALLEDQLKDLYSAENQLLKALPKMAERAASDTLKEAFESHLEETRGHVDRLQRAAEMLGVKLSGKKCKAMESLVEEGKEVLTASGDEQIVDLALIGAAQKVEHYEISAYGTARAIAEQLGQSEISELLQETLEEESATDEKLTHISEDEILPGVEAAGESEEEEEEAEEEDYEEPEEEAPAYSGRAGRRSHEEGRGYRMSVEEDEEELEEESASGEEPMDEYEEEDESARETASRSRGKGKKR